MIEFVIQMSGFQRRFHWMLSALSQQADPPAFRLRVDLSTHDPFGHLTPCLMRCFDGPMDIQWISHDGDDFLQRGFLRDQAMNESDAEWLLFSDADMIYPPEFLRDVSAKYLQGEHDANIMSVVRHGSTVENADAIINAADYTEPLPEAFVQAHQAWARHPHKTSLAGATGYFQLCRRAEALSRGTYYRDAINRDRPINLGIATDRRRGRTVSDCRFRQGWKVVEVDSPPLIHLAHVREWEKAFKGAIR